MYFDVSEFLSVFYQLQKLVFALPVLVFMFSFSRLALWALLSPVFGRFAGLVANAVAGMAAFAFFTQPDAFWKAVDFGCAAAGKVLGVSSGGPGAPLELLGSMEEELQRALDAVIDLMR